MANAGAGAGSCLVTWKTTKLLWLFAEKKETVWHNKNSIVHQENPKRTLKSDTSWSRGLLCP
jgi:hypothetical protein